MSTPQALRAEQLTLMCRQWLRVPLPVLAIAGAVIWLAWAHSPRWLALAWAAVTVGALVARMQLCRGILERGFAARQPELWSRRLTVFAGANGLVSGAAAPLFLPALPPAEQALFTVLMGSWGAGAVAANGSYPPAYYAFAWPLFLQLAAAWLFAGQEAAVWVVPILLFFALVLSAFVRENGVMVRGAIELRFANQKLLASKEELIGLLRAAYDKAEAARRSAEQASRSKSQFLASASHDLRQPLHALSLLTALLNDLAPDGRVREVGRHIRQSVESLEGLFNALLDLSRLDAGALAAEPRNVDLAALAQRIAVEYRAKAQEKGLRFEVRVEPDDEPLWLHADPILLERILRNLLENAVRFTDSGHVALRAARAGRDVVVSIADSGCGIPAAEQARVFEEFYQLHNPGRDRTRGLGLGLSIVRRLVDLLGYRVELASAPGQGSVFTLTLPNAASDAPQAQPAAAAAPGPDVAGLRVLVIEDDAEARRAMELTLKSWGCVPLAAASLDEARAALGAGRPDVLLSDLRLPSGGDGIAAIESLHKEIGPVPAALLSGDVLAGRLQATALPVLHKPVKPEALRELVHRLARGASS